MKECSKQMKLVDAAYDKGIINLAGKINAQGQNLITLDELNEVAEIIVKANKQ